MNDYSHAIMVITHPMSFPNGEGVRPAKDMTELQYVQLLASRAPRSMFGQNVLMLLDGFNRVQRHSTVTHANRHARFIKAGEWNDLATLTEEEISLVSVLAQANPRSSALRETLAAMRPPVNQHHNRTRPALCRPMLYLWARPERGHELALVGDTRRGAGPAFWLWAHVKGMGPVGICMAPSEGMLPPAQVTVVLLCRSDACPV